MGSPNFGPNGALLNVGTAAGVLLPANGGTGINNGAFTLTIPASGTAALLGASNVFTGTIQTLDHATQPQLLFKVAGVTKGEIEYFGAVGGYAQGGLSIGDNLDVALNRFVAGNVYVGDGSTTPILTVKKETGIFSPKYGSAVTSATTIAPTGNVFHVTGTTTITTIDSTNVIAGTTITIIFDGALTFTDGSNLKLASNFVTTADDTITLVYDGTNWFETARSVN